MKDTRLLIAHAAILGEDVPAERLPPDCCQGIIPAGCEEPAEEGKDLCRACGWYLRYLLEEVDTPEEPKHGEEKNLHHWRNEAGICGHEGDRAEKYCRTCRQWHPVGAGLKHGLIGWIICPGCNKEWEEKCHETD